MYMMLDAADTVELSKKKMIFFSELCWGKTKPQQYKKASTKAERFTKTSVNNVSIFILIVFFGFETIDEKHLQQEAGNTEIWLKTI